MNRITIQQLPASEITRIGEIDRAQHVTLAYRVQGEALHLEPAGHAARPGAAPRQGDG